MESISGKLLVYFFTYFLYAMSLNHYDTLANITGIFIIECIFVANLIARAQLVAGTSHNASADRMNCAVAGIGQQILSQTKRTYFNFGFRPFSWKATVTVDIFNNATDIFQCDTHLATTFCYCALFCFTSSNILQI
jgi:hypothetical protein